MFEQQEPNESRGASITVKEVLDRNADRIDSELADEPEIKARLMAAMGKLYHSLGFYQDAEPLMRGALDLKRTALGEDDLPHGSYVQKRAERNWYAPHAEGK